MTTKNSLKISNIEMIIHGHVGSSDAIDHSGTTYVAIVHWFTGGQTSIMAKDLPRYKAMMEAQSI